MGSVLHPTLWNRNLSWLKPESNPGRTAVTPAHAFIFQWQWLRILFPWKLHQVVENQHRFLIQCNYSGFNFSHYDLPFPTRYCIPYVRSGLYQLVIPVKGFRVSAHDLDTHCNDSFTTNTDWKFINEGRYAFPSCDHVHCCYPNGGVQVIMAAGYICKVCQRT